MESGTKIHRYTKEQDEFLRNNRDRFTFQELANEFNTKFKTSRTKSDIRYRCLSKALGERKATTYSEEQDIFLSENKNKYRYKELAFLFNEKYKTDISADAIAAHVQRTAGKKDGYDVGDEISILGYVWVKINNRRESGSPSFTSSVNWAKKNRYVYENFHGPIPDGKIIIFLDQNKNNCELNNLYCIDRSINAVMCKNRWFSTDPDLTLAAIKYCELFYALKQNKKGDKPNDH